MRDIDSWKLEIQSGIDGDADSRKKDWYPPERRSRKKTSAEMRSRENTFFCVKSSIVCWCHENHCQRTSHTFPRASSFTSLTLESGAATRLCVVICFPNFHAQKRIRCQQLNCRAQSKYVKRDLYFASLFRQGPSSCHGAVFILPTSICPHNYTPSKKGERNLSNGR